jgi:hypothetical protein
MTSNHNLSSSLKLQSGAAFTRGRERERERERVRERDMSTKYTFTAASLRLAAKQ